MHHSQCTCEGCTMWLGDNRYPLCSKHCAEAWADDNVDGEYTEDGLQQCGGFIEDGHEIEPGAVCAMCKKAIGG